MTSYLRIALFLLLIAFSSISNTKAQKFSAAQQQILQEKATELVQSYSDLMQNISKKEIADAEKISLMENWLGDTSVLIHNQIAPDDYSKFLSIEKYVKVIRNDYPSGIIIKVEMNYIEELKPGIMEVGKKKLYVTIPIKSSITGIYEGEKIVKNIQNYFLLFNFSKKDKIELNNFKFEGFQLEDNLFPLNDYTYSSFEFYYGTGLNNYWSELGGYSMNTSESRSQQFGFTYYKSINKFMGFNIGLVFNQISIPYEWNDATNYTYFTHSGSELSYNSPVEYLNNNAAYLTYYQDEVGNTI